MSGPEFDSMRERLRALAEADAGRGAAPEVERALLAAFREHRDERASRPAFRMRSFWPVWAAVATASAALAWVAVRGAMPGSETPAPKPVPSAIVVRKTPPPAAAVAEDNTPAPIRTAARPPSRKVSAGARSSRRAAEGTEPATRYYALAPDVDEAAIERLPSVRVRMPRSVLASFGLPVDVDRLHQPVKADVVLGEDGTARAIRFVSSPAY